MCNFVTPKMSVCILSRTVANIVCKYVAVMDLILFLFKDNIRRIKAMTKLNQTCAKSERMNRVSKKNSQILNYFLVLELKSLTIRTIFLPVHCSICSGELHKRVIKPHISKHYGTFDNSQVFQ